MDELVSAVRLDPKSRDEWVRDEWLEPLRGREDFRALTDVGVARPANRDGQRAVAQARRDRRVLTDPVERAALANAVLDERRFWRASLQAVERTLGNDDVAREFVAVVDLALGGPIDADVLDDDDLDDDAAYIDAAEDFVAAVLARRPRFSWIVRAVDKEIPNAAGVVPVLEALRVLERCCVKAIREGNEALSHYEAEPP
jgi:hypothetical protein